MQYRNTDKTIPEIGNELGVATLLEGGLQRSGKQVRINAQLIDTKTDEHIWAETFDRELTAVNLFEIQTEITQAITAALQAKLSPLEQRQVASIPTESLAAYEFYLRGRQSMSSRNEAAFREALDEFGEAVQIDPRFASAWAGMCEVRLSWYRLTSDTEHFESAETACNHAIDLDRDMIDVRVALGTLYRYSGDYARAGEELRLALETDPDNVDALIETGFIYSAQGRAAEAEVSLLKAAELKPHYRAAHETLIIFYRNHSDRPDRFKLAVNHALKAVELAPGSASAYNNLGTAYHSLEQFDAAKIAWDRALELEPTRTGYTNRGLTYYYEGLFEASAEMQKKAIELAPSDHRAWGRLAESSRFLEGTAEQAAEAYDTAIKLAEDMLRINDQDWQTQGLLAIYLLHSDRADEATSMVDRVLSLSNRKPEALYYAAIVAHVSGESEQALDMIAEALAGNEAYRYYFANDPDFKSLRSSERFQTVVGPG
jgi:tetratricopeptide (TPR) repeat protein